MTMNSITANNKVRIWKRTTFSTLLSGFGMWVTGGLYHNLILPSIMFLNRGRRAYNIFCF